MVIAADHLKLGSKDAAHPAPLGDLAQKVIQGLVDALKTAKPVVPPGGGAVALVTDLTATSAEYPGAVGLTALLTAIGNDLNDLLSEKVTLE